MITQNSRNTIKYAVFWYNVPYFIVIPITYLLVRLMEHMKRGPKSLQIVFTGSNLTHFGGLHLLQKFFQKLNLRYFLSHYIRFSQRNNRYSVAEEILALLYPIMLGLGRIETFHLLKHNGVFQYLTGLPAYPNPTTLRRFLLRMSPLALNKLRRLHDKIHLTMIQKPTLPIRVIFDLDSTVLVLYGKQEFAKIGYNPRKRGRASYHPLLCFNGITKDFWHGELRPGDTHTATGILELLEASFAKLPSSVRVVIIRADKGFYDHKTVEYLESRKALFAIVAKVTKPIKAKLSSLSYKKYTSGIEVSEFTYQPMRWEKEYRFIVIRRPIPDDPSEQLSLFSMGKYTYQVIVTNLKLKPLNIWKLYNGRASVELIIKELKEDYPLAKIPTKHFAANEVYFHLLLFAYNLINWFKRLCLPKEFQNMTLKTLRMQLLFVPGELVRTHNKPVLKFPSNFWYKDKIEYTLKQIEKVKL
ncbi:MAG: IS1380 family transposase [Nitrospirae bacterium]|nr:IS1380 family transposase [Nitrospirota bacterium]